MHKGLCPDLLCLLFRTFRAQSWLGVEGQGCPVDRAVRLSLTAVLACSRALAPWLGSGDRKTGLGGSTEATL